MTKTWFDTVYLFVGSVKETRIPVDTAIADRVRSELFAAQISLTLSRRPEDADGG
jgi:hypothetical protein